MSTPLKLIVGCDTFIINDKNEILLIKRADNKLWATPGGSLELDETPMQGAARECFEETGFKVKIIELLGVFSSNCYEFINFPWKDSKICHLFFRGKIISGEKMTSDETLEVEWFSEDKLPELSDGHEVRIKFGFNKCKNPVMKAYFE